ncbi:MAG: nucleotidyltransferase domain-containing protein [Desulfobacterales bacterium]
MKSSSAAFHKFFPRKIYLNKFNKIPDNILSLIPAAERSLHSHPKVLFAYLFGSLATGVRQPSSDVDIAVYLEGHENFSETKLEILESLTDVLQTDEIDLVIFNTASLPLAMNILRKKRIIVDKQPFTRHLVESLTKRKYFDFSIKESAILRRRYMDGR